MYYSHRTIIMAHDDADTGMNIVLGKILTGYVYNNVVIHQRKFNAANSVLLYEIYYESEYH